MNCPKDLSYTKDHEWVKFGSDGSALVGITDFAQHALGDIVYVTLPEEGEGVTAGEPFGEVESVKAVSEVFCPVTGEVTGVNESLNASPEKVNNDPYGAWLISVGHVTDKEDLMDAAAYEAFCAEGEIK